MSRAKNQHLDGGEISRRGFLGALSASLAAAGIAGCTRQPREPIVPYGRQPEDLIPGKPNFFATAMPAATGALPLLVKTDEYRPIKIDGNPEHAYNRGSSDVFAQAALLGLYDPDRSRTVLYRGQPRSWNEFALGFRERILATIDGTGVYFLSPTITSPTLARQWRQVQQALPKARLVQYEAAIAGTFLESEPVAQYALSEADVIVALDADFLSGASFPGFHKLTREYAARRKDPARLNRLYAIESSPTTTGLKAEHRLGVRASEIPAFAAELARAVGVSGVQPPAYAWSEEQRFFLQALAKDLKAHAGRSVVIPGLYQDSAALELAQAINLQLGNTGKTELRTSVPLQPLPSHQLDEMRALIGDLYAGRVDWLVIFDGNPAYATPADLGFSTAIRKAKTSIHLGLYEDETAQLSDWHIPAAHFLESWSDARSCDGTVSIVQPMIDPLFEGKSAHQFLQALLDEPGLTPYDAVRATWQETLAQNGGNFEANWRKALHDGWIAGTAFAAGQAAIAGLPGFVGTVPAPVPKGTVEVTFRPDPHVYDGRFANNGWLQEIPKPVTNLCWDNAALLSGAMLALLGLVEGDIVEIAVGAGKVTAPVVAAPGQAENSITVHLGYGCQRGRVAAGAGFDAYLVQQSGSPFVATGSIRKLEGKWSVAIAKSHMQDHRSKFFGGTGNGTHSLEANEALGERGIVRTASLAEFKAHPEFAHEGEGRRTSSEDESFFMPGTQAEHAWGLSIDMASCTGCNACVAACSAENNIPVVGKQQVRIGRALQWLRIDTYFEGDLAAPRAHFQPLACQQCELAPCEHVCPVSATVHTPDGLNAMVYDRCVGTRYCANNCPYGVRRFNYLLYSDCETESLKLMRNPDVSVRSRGVMEKCSYCVQRINAAKIEAQKENRSLAAEEVQTACQQACPAQAIAFGDLRQRQSSVAQLRAERRSYRLLEELNTRPRTSYVAEVTNPNPELERAAKQGNEK